MPLGTFAQWGRIFAGDTADGAGVTIRDFAFRPAEIRIRSGETVQWTNQDGTAHSVTARDGASDSGLLQPGGSFTHRTPS